MAIGSGGWRRLSLGAAAPKPVPALPQGQPGDSEADVACIQHGVEMSGRFATERSIRIEGEFRGELESASTVVVSESGAVEAPIRARTVEIFGAVVGDVSATREVVVHPTGRLHGDVETPSLVVARGAVFNGRSRMFRPERTVQAPAPASVRAIASPPESQA
jgi:cytoskeletal protein CcmA (bactofilin family)